MTDKIDIIERKQETQYLTQVDMQNQIDWLKCAFWWFFVAYVFSMGGIIFFLS